MHFLTTCQLMWLNMLLSAEAPWTPGPQDDLVWAGTPVRAWGLLSPCLLITSRPSCRCSPPSPALQGWPGELSFQFTNILHVFCMFF